MAKIPQTSGKRGRRTKFSNTGEESVLAFVARKAKPSTADIQANWSSEGRAGAADNSIATLIKKKKLTREPNKQGRGSRYSVV